MTDCIMGREPGQPGRVACSPGECRRCGFERSVQAERIRRIRTGEMTRDGLERYRLVVEKKGEDQP